MVLDVMLQVSLFFYLELEYGLSADDCVWDRTPPLTGLRVEGWGCRLGVGGTAVTELELIERARRGG
jgi:hypothetical protein